MNDPLSAYSCGKGALYMDFSKDIFLGSDVIGAARICREGLYYRFSCKCHLSGEVVFKIVADCGKETVNIGICVPKNGGFGLEKSVPVKMLGKQQFVLRAVPNHLDTGGKFIPLRPEEPFAYIQRLQNSHLEKRGDTVGIVLDES